MTAVAIAAVLRGQSPRHVVEMQGQQTSHE